MNATLTFVGVNFVLAILILWGLTFVDKYLRVLILLMKTPWHNVDTFQPTKALAYKGVYLWQKKGTVFWHTVYVGQSVNIYNRYKQHISDRGSHAIYEDYITDPSQLRFKAINIVKTHYTDLNALEKRLILRYRTNVRGYNKTAGNGSHMF